MAAIVIDAPKVLAALNINPKSSLVIAIQDIGNRIASSPNPLNTSNIIIAKLGVKPCDQVAVARCMAKALVREAIVQQDKYDVKKAEKAAIAHVESMKIKMPYLFIESSSYASTSSASGDGEAADGETPAVAGGKKGRGTGDLLNKALDVYRKFQDKSTGDCVTAMMKALHITYANAYYYFRKFKKG